MNAHRGLGISAAVEGIVDEAVLRRIVEDQGATLSRVYGKTGKGDVLRRLGAYNHAARFSPWIVVLDLDNDGECAPPYRLGILQAPSNLMCLRIAVREVETWLLADRQRIARFLSIPVSRLPQNPESIANPKQTMVNLARQSRRRAIREDMVPRPGGGREVGPAYTSQLIEFVQTVWHPGAATLRSESLRRCRGSLQELIRRATLEAN